MTLPLEAEQTWHDIACTRCGCVCDDLSVTVAGNRVARISPACPLAEPWFARLGDDGQAAATVAGRPVALDEAIEAAADLLRAARAPLVYGLSRSSTDGQRAAVRLADRLGATIDTTASRCHAPSIMALQVVGESTCSLGEAANRCDLVIFWGSNPAESHPRHWDRYSVGPAGQFVPGGRADRHVIVVDIEPNATSAAADQFVRVEPGSDFDLLWALRGLVRGVDLAVDAVGGVPRGEIVELARRLKSCRSGIVFFGLGLSRDALGHAAVEALLRLVADLNDHTRFYARRMRVPGDVAGADSVLCWQTGFPFSVNLARGYPRYNPGEYSASETLERGEADACVLVGSESVARLSATALAHLRRLPVIALDNPTEPNRWPADVAFTTAIYGVHAPGTAYRMDEVPIPLRSFLSGPYATDGQVLRAIDARLAGGKGGGHVGRA